MRKKLVLFLMNQKGYYVLINTVKKHGFEFIDFVVSSRDINVQEDYYDQIMCFCKEYNIMFYDKTEDFQIQASYAFAIGWRWIIPNLHNGQLIVFHDSLLPKYRGFAPLVSCLINGESTIGVSAIKASDNYDTGDIIDQEHIDISYPIKIKDAIESIQILYYRLADKIISKILRDQAIIGYKQNEAEATYSLWRDEDDYVIQWCDAADYIDRFIDAVGAPYLGACSYIHNKKIRIFDAEVVSDVHIENRTPGKVIFVKDGAPVVVCGQGLIKITKAVYEESGKSILPLTKFRTRFN